MGENPSTPPPPRQLEYDSHPAEAPKPTTTSRFILILVWALGLVSWSIWLAIVVYVFLKFLVFGKITPRAGDSF